MIIEECQLTIDRENGLDIGKPKKRFLSAHHADL